jgi:hypothetical protein
MRPACGHAANNEQRFTAATRHRYGVSQNHRNPYSKPASKKGT